MQRTFRVTPNPVKFCKVANNDINLDYIEKTFIKNPRYRKFIISREYKDKKDKFSLHYHGYFDTVYSKNTVRGHLKGMCKKQYKGNEYVSISQKEDLNEFGRNYICKDDDVVIYKGFTKKDIEKFIKNGKEYKEKKKLYKMSWNQRVWYYIDEKGFKDKLLETYRRYRKFYIEENILPIILQISGDLNINPPPPHVYHNCRMSVLRVLFPNAFRQWYISYIRQSVNYKGDGFITNENFLEDNEDRIFPRKHTCLPEDPIKKNIIVKKIKNINYQHSPKSSLKKYI